MEKDETGKLKYQYFKLYKQAHKNGADLLNDARILFEEEKYPRAYFLAFTALEEIAKSQAAADVFTGLIPINEFEKCYLDHKKKIGRMKWAHKDAGSFPHNKKWIGPDRDDIEIVDPQEPIYEKRQNSLYVKLDDRSDLITVPDDCISKKDATDIVHIMEVALERIWESTEYLGHDIGTKGFLK